MIEIIALKKNKFKINEMKCFKTSIPRNEALLRKLTNEVTSPKKDTETFDV